jgi:hypothetical protein
MSSPMLKERLIWGVAVCAAGLAGAGGALWSQNGSHTMAMPMSHGKSHASHTGMGHDHKGPSEADIQRVLALNQGKPILPKCRQDAFVDASNMINTIVQINKGLPPTTPALVHSDLDSLLYTTLKQAKSEVHCVAGGLTNGYDKSYAISIQRGMKMAEARKLSPDVVAIGQSVVDTLYANKPVAAAN